MINKNRLVKRFIKYVKIASPSCKEEKIGKLLVEEFRALGCSVSQDKLGNIFAYFRGDDKSRDSILLNAHIDTVAHNKPIRPKIKNGIITSSRDTILGADNKAGVAVILEVLQAIREEKLSHSDIQVILTVQEEIGLFGSREIKKKDIKARSGFVLDGGEISNIHNQGPAQFNLTATIIGKPAHAGVHPEDGINAIKVASEAIAKMKLGRIDFETTANIGIIQGGTATNIVPDEVELQGEARSHQVYKLNKQIKHMEQVLKKTCAKHHATTSIKTTHMYKAFQIDPCKKIVVLAQKAVEKAGFEPLLDRTGGGSDANIFNALGI